MQLRKKIRALFLLAVYLLIVLHYSASHSHTTEATTPSSWTTHHHQHEASSSVHHDHQFHGGLFHFLGHLFENVHHSSDLADTHLVVSQKKTSPKKFDNDNQPVDLYTLKSSIQKDRVDSESLSDPPPCQFFLSPRLIRPNTPLRAPPALVWPYCLMVVRSILAW